MRLLSIVSLLLINCISVQANAGVSEDCEQKFGKNTTEFELCLITAHDSLTQIKAFFSRHELTQNNWIERSTRGFVPALIFKRCNDEFFEHHQINDRATCLKEEEKLAVENGQIGGQPGDAYIFEDGFMGDLSAMGVTGDYLSRHGLRVNKKNEGIDVSVSASNGGKPAMLYVKCKSEHDKDRRKIARCLLNQEPTLN